MLSSHEYTKAVDVWSTGCSFGEVLSGKVLFPGQNYIEQIVLIINMRGSPDQHTLSQISNEYALKYVKSLPEKEKVNLETLFPNTPPDALDLIDKLLDMNPERRITTEQALKHPFLASLHDEEDEPVFTGNFDFSFEQDASLTMVKIQRLIMR
jgi:mitogen-activated protein kinase 1/3